MNESDFGDVQVCVCVVCVLCVCCVCVVCVCVCVCVCERERERDWKDAELVPLDKKGDRMKCEISVGSPSSACQGRRCP